MHGKTALERAFDLADEGVALPDIRATIRKEGYDPDALYGMTVTLQLARRIVAAKENEPKPQR